jgi:hypothetical protein
MNSDGLQNKTGHQWMTNFSAAVLPAQLRFVNQREFVVLETIAG